jgi:hypothetical protein
MCKSWHNGLVNGEVIGLNLQSTISNNGIKLTMLKSTEKKIIRIVKTAIPIAIEADEAFRAKCAISHTSPTLMDEEIHELRVLNAVYRKLKVGSTEIIKNEQFI